MQYAVDLSWMKSLMSPHPWAGTFNEGLALALVGSNQVAFDWRIQEDELYFSGAPSASMKGLPMNFSRIWKSEDLHSLMHADDKLVFRTRLHAALKGCDEQSNGMYQVEVRLKDNRRGWRWIGVAGKIVERGPDGRALRMVGTFSDIDERKRREQDVIRRERLKNAILTAAIDAIVTMDHHGRIIAFNDAAEQAFGRSAEDVLGTNLEALLATTTGINFADGSFPMNRRLELEALRIDGSAFPVELTVVPLPAHEQKAFAAFIRDISDRKRSEAMQAAQTRILEMMANGAGLSCILAEIKRLAISLSGAADCAIMLHGDVPESIAVQVLRTEDHACMEAVPISLSRTICARDGTLLGTLVLSLRTPTPHAEETADAAAYLAGLAVQSRMSDERIRFLAHYDGLTGLPNRFLFEEYFDLALKGARRHGTKFAVCFVDLDKFKEVNDTLGHDAGDEVLRIMARRFRGALRHTDKIARMGGDEFYVLIEDLKDGCHAAEVASKLLEQAYRPVSVNGTECRLSASIGISIYPDHGLDDETLLQHADSAMYQTKKRGKNGYSFFSKSGSLAPVRPVVSMATERTRSSACYD